MLATGLNGFINAQGHPRVGMGTTLLGAALNLVLDPVFIFVLGMGVQGAAIATVISQLASMVWVLVFFAGRQSVCRIRRENLRLRLNLVRDILGLGMSGFIMAATNCLVQVVCNATLRVWGGDLYVGVMTILNSVREILSLPVNGITSGAQPVLSYNFGAQRYSRVREGIRFTALLGAGYTVLAWLLGAGYTVLAWALVIAMPHLLVSIFTSDPAMLEAGQIALKQYFFGFFFMAFQFVGQSCFTSLRCPKRAIFAVPQAGHLLLSAAQGGDRGPPDHPAAPVGDGDRRRLLGRAHLQRHRRPGLLCHHVADPLPPPARPGRGGI